MKKEELIKALEYLLKKVSSLEHSQKCESRLDSRSYCTCHKDSTESFLYTIIDNIRKEEIVS